MQIEVETDAAAPPEIVYCHGKIAGNACRFREALQREASGSGAGSAATIRARLQ